jgi:ABC-2 type transport system permease protein
MISRQTRAIVWAQWCSTRNRFFRANRAGTAFTTLLGVVWYGGFCYLAVVVAFLLSNPDEPASLRIALPAAFLICFLYWQLIPVLTASMGSSLDIRKLLVYPIQRRDLFRLEVVLRTSTSVEMLLLLTGAGIGLLLNPKVPRWAPLALLPFVAFNLLCSAGVRDLLVRLLARKRVREIVVFLLVLAAALPQALLLTGGSRGRLRQFFSSESSVFWPWTATARLAEGEFSWLSVSVLFAWLAAAYVFGRWQFERGLSFDLSEAAARSAPSARAASRLEWWYGFPNLLLRDPLAALVEKELRFLTRTPRFRLVFTMGFSFGLLIWLPMTFGSRAAGHSLLADNYLTAISVYALLILSDVLFWNCFGFDRGAIQAYYLAPVKMSLILAGKNLAAVLFVVLDVAAIALVCTLLRLPLSALQILETISVTCVVTLFILSIGNLSSLYNPRAVDPEKSFRSGASARAQAMLTLAFPVALLPVALAYLARYAFDSEWALFGTLGGGAVLGAIVYAYSMGSAVRVAEERKETIIASLSRGEGPVAS